MNSHDQSAVDNAQWEVHRLTRKEKTLLNLQQTILTVNIQQVLIHYLSLELYTYKRTPRRLLFFQITKINRYF